MGSQSYITSLFKTSDASLSKASYSRHLMNTPTLKSFITCMCMPSCANSSDIATKGIRDLMPPLLNTKNVPLVKYTNSLFMDQHEHKVIPPTFDPRIHKLKENTTRNLMTTQDPVMAMKLIDTIQRLGIGYYFEEEINEVLEKVTQILPNDGLYTMALNFRLRRHNGLHTDPAKVFKKFMDENGMLNISSSSEDIEGLLSLYEASYLGASGEDLLSRAKEITTKNLHRISPKLDEEVIEGLKLPRHMRMERLESRRYIEEYGNEDDHNPVLLEFAKLDYNYVQSLLQKELLEVTRWWENLGLASKLYFVRDRHVECFLWTIGLLPNPNFSNSRIELAKVIAIMLVIDDIYDTYGSYNDLVLFTKAIQRWDLNEMEQLPDYMKICYMALYNINNDICYKVLKERGLSVQPFLQKTWIDLVEAYMVEIKWVKKGIIPNLKEYMENGVITSGAYMALVHLFFFISKGVTKENMRNLLDPYPKFFTLAGTILRLWDDLGTTKEEHERGDVLSSIQLLMKDKNITCDEEGRTQILVLIHELWKDLNSELVKPDVMHWSMIRVALNMSRTSQVVYQHNEDSYLSSVQDQVQSLFFKPIDM
nr:terpenoids synthase [Blumea balsamifera]